MVGGGGEVVVVVVVVGGGDVVVVVGGGDVVVVVVGTGWVVVVVRAGRVVVVVADLAPFTGVDEQAAPVIARSSAAPKAAFRIMSRPPRHRSCWTPKDSGG